MLVGDGLGDWDVSVREIGCGLVWFGGWFGWFGLVGLV